MASGAFTSAGTTISVTSEEPGSYDATGFGSLSFDEIGEVTDLGEFGREYNLVTHNPLGSRQTVKRKGSFNDGTISMSVARTPTDTGQGTLQSAVDDDANYSFKVELQDGRTLYFVAQVMTYTTNVGSVDQITSASISLEITDEIIEEPAA